MQNQIDMAQPKSNYKIRDYNGGESLQSNHSKIQIDRDIAAVERILPSYYIVDESAIRGSIHCVSRLQRGIDDDERWDYTFKAIKQHFGDRFQEVFHNTCTNHIDFTIYLKPVNP
jgi:hypothetical protein